MNDWLVAVFSCLSIGLLFGTSCLRIKSQDRVPVGVRLAALVVVASPLAVAEFHGSELSWGAGVECVQLPAAVSAAASDRSEASVFRRVDVGIGLAIWDLGSVLAGLASGGCGLPPGAWGEEFDGVALSVSCVVLCLCSLSFLASRRTAAVLSEPLRGEAAEPPRQGAAPTLLTTSRLNRRAATAPAPSLGKIAGEESLAMTEVRKSEVPLLSLRGEAERLLDDRWSVGCLALDIFVAWGATEIAVEPWLEAPVVSAQGEAGRDAVKRFGKRVVTARLPVPECPLPLFPSSTRARITCEVCVEGCEQVSGILIDCHVVAFDTPYCDSFSVLERLTLEHNLGGKGIVASKHFALMFAKRTMAKKMIETACKMEQERSGIKLMQFLTKRAAEADSTFLSQLLLAEGEKDAGGHQRHPHCPEDIHQSDKDGPPSWSWSGWLQGCCGCSRVPCAP